MTAPRVWFITGASSGFGRIMTESLLKQGHKVVATLRRPDVLSDLASQYPATQLVVVKLDVTKKDEVMTAFEKAREAFGRIDVVFNNAGKAVYGELESVNDDDVLVREMFEINFWGAVHVSREAVRFFREVNQPMGGRLLQVSSGLGLATIPCCGHVSASKYALEGLSEALAKELDPAWNIKVTILEPGPFRTQILANGNVAPPHPAYTGPDMPGMKLRNLFEYAVSQHGDPNKACIAFEKASRLEDPPLRLPLHRKVLGMATEKGHSLVEAAEKYKDWSDDLNFD